MDLNWNLLTDASANLGNALTNAAGQVRQHRETAKDRRALRNYLTQPSVRGQNRGIGPFGNEGGTTPSTLPGQTPGFGDGDPGNRPVRIDPVTRQPVDTEQEAFLQLAERNPQLAFRLRDEQRQAIQQLNTTQQAHLRQAGELLRDVRDDAGYQRALQAGHMAGIDVAGAPPTYDPNFVERVRVAARAVAPPTEQHPTNIQREIEYYRSIGRNDLAQQLMENHAEGAPVLFDVTGDGVPDLVPRSYVRQQGGASPAPQVTPQSSPQGDPDVMVNPQTGQMIRFNRQTNQWEPIQGATPTVSSDLQNWRGAGSGPQGFR